VRNGDTNSIQCRWRWSIGNDWNTSIKFVKSPTGAVTRAIYQSGAERTITPKLAVVIDINVDPRTYDAFVGQYAFAKGAPLMSITRRGRHLFSQYGSGPTYEIFPDSPTEFFWITTNAKVTFNRDRDGAVTGATMHLRGGTAQKMMRVAQGHVE
jgi:hypothetical protein